MKTLKISGLLLAASLIIFSSCKKDDPEPAKSRTELLTRAGGWKYTDYTMAGTSMFSMAVDDCEKDNIEKYTSAGAYTVTEGADDCNSNYDGTGTWKLIANDTKLVQSINGSTDTLSIKDITATTLKLSYSIGGIEMVDVYTGQ